MYSGSKTYIWTLPNKSTNKYTSQIKTNITLQRNLFGGCMKSVLLKFTQVSNHRWSSSHLLWN